MRASTAFFAGAGTVIVAIAAGLGGGLVMGNIMSPQPGHHAFSRFERRAAPPQSPRPWPITTAKTADAAVPYLAATEKAIARPMVVPPSQGAAQKTASTVSRPNSAARPVSAAQQSTPPQPQLSPMQQASSDPDNANAQARDADLKRLDAKKNRSDRRRQWAARRAQQQQLQDQREADNQAWNDSRDGNKGWDAKRRSGDNRGWRDARDGSREMIVRREAPDESDRPLFGPPMWFDFPHFNLFGRD